MSTSKVYTGENEEPVVPEEPTDEVAERGFSLKERMLNPRSLISIAIAVAIIIFVFRGFDINLAETWQQMRKVNPALYLLAFATFYLTFPIRALRWRILLRNANFPVDEGRHSWASLPALTEYIGLSWFANCVVPAKLGDAYRGYLLKHNGDVSFSRSFGTIFAERLLDMIVLFALLVASGWSVFGTRLPSSARYVFIFGLFLVIVIVTGLAAMRFLSPLIRRIIPSRLERVYGSFEAGTLGSLKARSLPLLFFLTSLVWMGESLRLFLVIEAMGGLHLNLLSVIFVALMGSLLTTVPATPGGLGLVEGGIIGVLSSPLFGVPIAIASAVAVLDRVINYWSIVIFGFVLYLFSKRK
ncbi:MAG TPA: lysylphosphatidylglycerol synthase transmembrane domain-containing protein [Herpetosiphonaceae bacterium]